MHPSDEAAITSLGVDSNGLAYLELRQPLDEILHFKNFVGAAAKQGYLFHLLNETLFQFPTDDATGGGSCHTYICHLSHPSNLEFFLVCFVRFRSEEDSVQINATLTKCRKFKLRDIRANLPTCLFGLLNEIPYASNYMMENWPGQPSCIIEVFEAPVRSQTKLKGHLNICGAERGCNINDCYLWFSADKVNNK
jgi:hypothetical protein